MFTVVLAVAGAVTVWPQAPQPKLDLVIDRLMAYTGAYPEALGRIVAEEHYEQRVRHSARSSDGHTAERLDVRITKAELGLAQVGREWVGIRDVVEVDGVAVPDAGRRLERALAQPDSGDAVRAILRDNSRFNVEDSRIGRNINVPTMALEFLRPCTGGASRLPGTERRRARTAGLSGGSGSGSVNARRWCARSVAATSRCAGWSGWIRRRAGGSRPTWAGSVARWVPSWSPMAVSTGLPRSCR